MPLIPQQDIVTVRVKDVDFNPKSEHLIEMLKQQLESYPPVRILSLSEWSSKWHEHSLTAVIETV
ncbi:MAG: hypothetical protein ACOYBP_02470 [Microbacteriaceae bacterium]